MVNTAHTSTSTKSPSPYMFNIDPELLLRQANKSLVVKEAWVMWEPIRRLQMLRGLTWAFKHSFFVFVLDTGEWLDNTECRYLRVERQQLVVPGSTEEDDKATDADALLNFRFCREPLVVKGLDIEDFDESNVTDARLLEIGVEQWPTQPIQFEQQLLLGELLDTGVLDGTIESVHREKKQYDVANANCIWFVRKVISRLVDQKYVSHEVLQQVEGDLRFSLPRSVQNCVEVAKEIADALLPIYRKYKTRIVERWQGTTNQHTDNMVSSVIHD